MTDFVDAWFAAQEPRELGSGCTVLSAAESDALHRKLLSWSASVWGRYAFFREVVPLIKRGNDYFGAVRGATPDDPSPVIWVDVYRDVHAGLTIGWPGLIRQLTTWDDRLNDVFPIHFHEPDLKNTSFKNWFGSP